MERIDDSWDGKSFSEPLEKITLRPAALAARQQHHAGNIGEFLDAIDAGTLPQTVAADNLKSLAMVEAAVESARRGEAVTLS